jgi:hypothetical protein
MFTRSRRRLIGALIVAAVVVPAAAWASRAPTRTQRVDITILVHRRINPMAKVSKLRISSVDHGAWAVSLVTLLVGGQPDNATAIYHHVDGRWTVTRHSPGTAGVQCGIAMPAAAQRDLGLPVCH